MLRKTITYTDYNGTERTENFYFNLNSAELMDMELGTVGGMRQMLQTISEKQNIPEIIKSFKDLLFRSYGEKSADGKRFIKSDELSRAFMQTEAYSKLYMELITDANAAADFINAVVPEEIAQAAAYEREQREKEAKAEIVQLDAAREEKSDEPQDASLING